ncbi:MAG: sulfatase-like hydrolase/transferase [Maricaulis sp.]|uniref:sulfatase-like hydrolase/transferase n=1 Tax=Maricaulis sp. TaxID=1486257 RepID=UPI001B034372|nr:sulfatase-like hydrolase/transferase [Maricaulis sp.]MBO6696626.1 sulfatase-like hydrolase/transferase [Henriciella sp.]MBO6729093.1 sulfatase-like hydrolase/transferase [Maricaulis sp.]MBO6878367.1 sulfatase-like hydrolase/transferase [Maricaulis sp.]
MRTWQKFAAGFLVLIVAAIAVALSFRTELILWAVKNRDLPEVAAETPEINWQQGPDFASQPASDRPPNVILILADDLGINDISAFGGGVAGGLVPTPNIDRLATEGVNFVNGYAGNATCSPSRAMLMTGRYATNTGFEFTPTPAGMGRVVTSVSGDIRPDLPAGDFSSEADGRRPVYEDQGLPTQEVTVAEMLGQAGYHNVHIGKWHLGVSPGIDPLGQGFDESLLMSEGMYLPEDSPEVVNARVDFDPIDRFLWASQRFAGSFNRSELFAPGGYLTDWWTEEALRAIEANRNRPFFLYLGHWAPHTPLQATRADYEAVGDIQPHRLRVYASMIRALDRSVGEILDRLEEEGLAENTVVIFSSDNGGAGYIGLPEVNAPYRGWKLTLFEGGLRVPFMMRWPAGLPAGRVVEQPVTHIDIFRTIASITGAELPEREIDGVDLLPVASGSGPLERVNDAIFWQSGTYWAVRAGDWKFQIDQSQDKSWLFNLASDPTEQFNLIDQHPDIAERLLGLLNAHHEGRRQLYPAVTSMPVMIDKSLAEEYEEGDELVFWPN